MPKKIVREERKIQIMESLYNCLLKNQFHEITLIDIASEAGINQGMIHYFYKKKDDLLLHFIDYIEDQFRTNIIEYMNTEKAHSLKGKALLRHAMNFSNERITLNRDLTKIFIEIWGIANHNIKVRKKLRHLYDQWIFFAKDILIKTGLSSQRAEDLSNTMVSFFEGNALLSMIFDLNGEQIRTILNEFQNKILEMIDE